MTKQTESEGKRGKPRVDLVNGWLDQALDALRANKPVMAFHYVQKVKEELGNAK
jgi:hypothetical protein